MIRSIKLPANDKIGIVGWHDGVMVIDDHGQAIAHLIADNETLLMLAKMLQFKVQGDEQVKENQ